MSEIMDPNSEKESNLKEENDSGVDNTSESGHSGDEDHQAIPSDDELLNSDNESNSNEKKFSTETDVKSVADPSANFEPSKAADSSSKDLDVRIELNNNESYITEEYKEVVEFYADLASSQCETVDFSVTSDSKKPDWFDEEKFKRGQKFARNHLFCINYAEMLSLFILFAQKSSLGPLIFTGKSDSPYSAFKRYLSTISKLMTWYEDDIWNDSGSSGAKNLATVRGMHKNVYQNLTNSSQEDLAKKTTLGDPNTTAIWCPMRDLIVKDFRESLPPPPKELEQYEQSLACRKVWVNQADMSMTQFGFVGLAVTYPEYFGIYYASDEDLDAFLHLWRCLGYLLGIKDKYNYCNTSLEYVKLRTKFFIEVIAKPAFRNVTCDWEHMCRCLTAGISYYLPVVNFESSLLYLCHMLKIETPRLRKEITYRSYLIFLVHRITFYFMKIQGVLQWFNSRMYAVIRKAQNSSPEVLRKWESKEYSYTQQPGKCPIRGYLQATTDV